jgi:hypothetical protein
MRRTALLCVLAMLTGCQTTSIVIDAGCQTYDRYKVRPSRQDTPLTARDLYVLDSAMTAACAQPEV